MRAVNGRKWGATDKEDGVETDINEWARRCAQQGQGRQEGDEKSRGTAGAQRLRRGKVQAGGS